MEQESRRSVSRRRRRAIARHVAEFALAGGFAMTVLIADRLTTQSDSIGIQITAFSLPTIMLSIWFLFYVWQLRRMPEFEQSIATRALATAFGLTVWIATIWGLGTIFIEIPALPLAMVAPLSAAIYAITRAVLAAKYR